MANYMDNWREENGFRSKPQACFYREKSFGVTSQDDDLYDNEAHAWTPSTRTQPIERKTIFFTSLPPDTTYEDLVTIVRGGRLLDISLRKNRAAQVTFMEGAGEFLKHARKNDLYIRNKRVEVRWADRQLSVASHVVNKMSTGATRNLVVRNSAHKLTEDIIRKDLDHIHNLVVIHVHNFRNDVFISTNSVHNALFARTCMMSRILYRGLKLEWYADECAAPLPKSPTVSHTVSSVTSKPSQQVKVGATRVPPSANRFGVLDIEDGEASDEEQRRRSNGSHGVWCWP